MTDIFETFKFNNFKTFEENFCGDRYSLLTLEEKGKKESLINILFNPIYHILLVCVCLFTVLTVIQIGFSIYYKKIIFIYPKSMCIVYFVFVCLLVITWCQKKLTNTVIENMAERIEMLSKEYIDTEQKINNAKEAYYNIVSNLHRNNFYSSDNVMNHDLQNLKIPEKEKLELVGNLLSLMSESFCLLRYSALRTPRHVFETLVSDSMHNVPGIIWSILADKKSFYPPQRLKSDVEEIKAFCEKEDFYEGKEITQMFFRDGIPTWFDTTIKLLEEYETKHSDERR